MLQMVPDTDDDDSGFNTYVFTISYRFSNEANDSEQNKESSNPVTEEAQQE